MQKAIYQVSYILTVQYLVSIYFFFSHLTIKKNFVSLLDSFQENDKQKYKISPVSFDYETR